MPPTEQPIALTGGSGFVGSHVAEALLAAGYKVRALVRRPDRPGWLKGMRVEVVPGDVNDFEATCKLVEGVAAVVHVAGLTSAKELDEYRHCNAGGTKNVVTAVRRLAKDAHVVLVSSQAAAGPSPDGRPVKVGEACRPVSSYGKSKLEAEMILNGTKGIGYTILRPSAVYGPREKAIKDLFVLTSKGFTPILGGGKPMIQLVFAPDVARSVVAILERGPRGETFFAAHPEVLSYTDIARILSRLRTPPAKLVNVSEGLVRVAGKVMGVISFFREGPPVFNAEKANEMLQPAWVCDVGPAQEALGSPFTTSFEKGAAATMNWYRDEGWIKGG